MLPKFGPFIDNIALGQLFCHYQLLLFYFCRRVIEKWELVEFGNGLWFWSLS